MSEESRKRLVVVAGSVTLSAIFALLAFLLGSWGFDARRYNIHRQRLEGMLKKSPQLGQVVQGLADESSPLIAAPTGPAELARVARAQAGAKEAEVLEKARRWPLVRVFRAGDMIYFIFFDAGGVMRDYSYVSA